MDRRIERAAAVMLAARGIGYVEIAQAIGTSARRAEGIIRHEQNEHLRQPHALKNCDIILHAVRFTKGRLHGELGAD